MKSEIRLTPNDLMDFDRPPRQRTSRYMEPMMELFERGALAGMAPTVSFEQLEYETRLMKEYIWIDTIRQDLESIPSDEGQFIDEMIPFIDGDKFILAEYGL